MKQIRVASEFTRTPGGRYRDDGSFSGQQFREDLLEPLFQNENDDEPVLIILDGVYGYATSFLEEAFGGLVRKFGPRVISRLRFESKEEPLLIREIMKYLSKAESHSGR